MQNNSGGRLDPNISMMFTMLYSHIRLLYSSESEMVNKLVTDILTELCQRLNIINFNELSTQLDIPRVVL